MDANTMLAGKYLNASDLQGRSVRVTISADRCHGIVSTATYTTAPTIHSL